MVLDKKVAIKIIALETSNNLGAVIKPYSILNVVNTNLSTIVGTGIRVLSYFVSQA